MQTDEETEPVQVRFLRAQAVMQVTRTLPDWSSSLTECKMGVPGFMVKNFEEEVMARISRSAQNDPHVLRSTSR